MAFNTPKRIVLRLSEEYELDWEAIIQTYFATLGSDPGGDFYPHLLAPNMSTKMHIILDLHCETVPSVDTSAMEYEVFKVKKAGEFQLKRVDGNACKIAQKLCSDLKWGTDRNYPEEADGVRLAQFGHSPGKLVS